MSDYEKSDPSIVPTKPTNKTGEPDRRPALQHRQKWRYRPARCASFDFARACQGKVEMSYSLQSRNVRFCGAGERVRVILTMPVKRRRAMLARNPIWEDPARTQRGRWVGRGPSVASLDWGSLADQREAVPRPQVCMVFVWRPHRTDRFRHA